jgi:glycosyltransferase involved in cell wall biosynthesis
MRSLVFLVPGRLETRTGGYAYDRRMIEGLRQQGWSVEVLALGESFPNPSPAALRHASDLFTSIRDGSCVLVDGLALSAMPEIVEQQAARLRIAALVHLPLAANVTLTPEEATRLAAAERRALDAVALVVVTGMATVALLGDYRLPREKIVVVEPGTERRGARSSVGRDAKRPGESDLRRPSRRGASNFTADKSRPALLTVATVHSGKGHEPLVAALARLKHRSWELTCAGSLTRDPLTVERVRKAVIDAGLDEQVALVGELDEEPLRRAYDRADVFVLATLQETYGMAVAEALAHGLPVVATTTGAIPELVGSDAGILVPPGDVAALAHALDRVIGDAELRAQLAAGASRAAERLPTWEQAAHRMSDALGTLVQDRRT